jgi:hypothetical protein
MHKPMKATDNKELLREAAVAFNNIADRSAWYDYHTPSVQAYGLAPAALDARSSRAAVWRITVTGTHKGDFQGAPASGKFVKFDAHYSFRFENGKIVERWSTLDRLSVLIQIGAVSLPACPYHE